MAKVTMAKNDWESLMVVSSRMSALKLTLAQIFVVENVIDLIRKGMGTYFDEKKEILDKGEKFLAGYRVKLDALLKKYSGDTKHPEVEKLAEEGRKELDIEVNDLLSKLQKEELELDISDELFEPFKLAFSVGAFFGDKGYNDNEHGKAAFVRTMKALGIKTEDLKASESKTVEEKDNKNS
ncbi:hypothetical protein M0R04_06210 [Candidatus Dojkabacteria bacterium]|jgi:hypothetical protein|nr:hypothetical protein [Candidatus Dojkabacteria bacterium]